MRKFIGAFIALLFSVGLVALPTAAQANTGCVSSSEWASVSIGMSKTKAQSVMGATGTRVASSTTNNSNGTHTLREAIQYTPCSSLSWYKPIITYQELVSPAWAVLIPWYVQDKILVSR